MTSKVFKGSLWMLLSQVAPLGISIFATPIVIRLLGSEAYGVLILVALIPTYFAFADFGMDMASTKFSSEAYAAADAEKEGLVVRTSAIITVAASAPIGLAIFLLSWRIAGMFNVPENLHADAALALKIASATFVVAFLSNIFNTPQVVRLRLGPCTVVNAGFRMLGIIATPVVIYFGFGIVGVASVLLATALMTLAAQVYLSGRLLPNVYALTIDRGAVRPLLKFGGALVGASIAGLLLANAEKAILPLITSVRELAYYSVAFTIASMLTMFSNSMGRALLPAFSQMINLEDRAPLRILFLRGIRFNLIFLVPAILFLMVVGKPFLTMWAGTEFGEKSIIPFLILLIGLAFNVLTYLPFTVILASGRTDILAKIYWLELLPFLLLAATLIHYLGGVGAAIAWSSRIIIDSGLVFFATRRVSGLWISSNIARVMLVAGTTIIIPFTLSFLYGSASRVVVLVSSSLLILYALFVWKFVLERDELDWFVSRTIGTRC